MMASFQIQEILDATGGKLLQGDPRARVRSVTTDSRKIKKGALFIAIVGKKHDAHDFIPGVVKAGAGAVLVSRKMVLKDSQAAVIEVEDTTKALGDLARYHRQRFSIPVIALTGSAGKTTTKEMIVAVLKKKFSVLKNVGTENNQYGVPLTLLKLNKRHEVAVIEVGTNQPGDIPWLASIVEPTVAAITNIGESHLELLKTPADVFKEKFSLIKALKGKGIAIINRDDKYLKDIPSVIKQKCLSFGIQSEANYRAKNIEVLSRGVQFKVKGLGLVKMKGFASANVLNALIAICCGRLLGISYNDIKKSIEHFVSQPGRQGLIKAGRIHLIDDSYNANPVSFRSSLQVLSQFVSTGRRILVCGDMLELGAHSERLHREIGRLAGQAKLDAILSFGEYSKLISSTAGFKASRMTIFHADQRTLLEKKLTEILQPGDVVLVKGSRGMHMEHFVEYIKKNFS